MNQFRNHQFFIPRLLVSLVLGFGLSNVRADFFSPGPLSKYHAKDLSGFRNCFKCHSGNREKACASCHKPMGIRIKKRKGYHSYLWWEKNDKSCTTCHSEHKGKDYDLKGLSRIDFNHDHTGWPLVGKHKKVNCEKCHTEYRKHTLTQKLTKSRTYLDAPTECKSCHEDVHRGKYGSYCEDCHEPVDWNTMRKRDKSILMK